MNSRKMMEQWSGLSEKEGDAEETEREEAVVVVTIDE